MNTEHTLFTGDNQVEVSEKSRSMKVGKSKKPATLYASFTLQEIMELFDWGFIFPSAYLPLLLGENDYKARFQALDTSYVVPLSSEPYNAADYFLELDSSDLDPFLEHAGGTYYTTLPFPSHFVKRIVCKDQAAKDGLSKLWAMTDNDDVETQVSEFKATTAPAPAAETSQDQVQHVLGFIQHLDRCLGAICFTKDLDPFIQHHFKGYPGVEEFSNMTISNHFLLLIQEWLPIKNKKVLESVAPPPSEKGQRYAEFFDRVVSKKWDDPVSGTYLKELASNAPIDSILSSIALHAQEEEQKRLAQKVLKALKEIDLGIMNFKEALEDDDLRKPYPLFLILLKLYYRKGKLETDAQAFRNNLFEKDFIKNPRNISLVGALYGYYIGYHNLRRYENIKYIGELDIIANKDVLNFFRLKLSHSDPFEKEAFNVIYNKVASFYPGTPQLKVNVKASKESGKDIVKEVPTSDGEKKIFKFVHLPVLGQHGYKLVVTAGENKFIKRVVKALEVLLKRKVTKVACLVLLLEFLKANRVQLAGIFDNATLVYSKGEPSFGLDVDMVTLVARLEFHLETCKEPGKFVQSLSAVADSLDCLTPQSLS